MQCRHSIWLGSVTCSRVSCSSRGSRGDAHRRCQQWHQADPRGKCLGLFGAIVRGTCVLYAATPVQRGKPETFDFLGFTHCCSTNRSGGFQILRLTVKKRMRATLLAIRDELKRRRHEPIQAQGQWLTRVVRDYFNYHAVPGDLIRLGGFRSAACRLWRQALKRRSQRNRLQWSRYGRLADLYIPRPRNAHPYPEDRFASHTRGRSRMR